MVGGSCFQVIVDPCRVDPGSIRRVHPDEEGGVTGDCERG